MPLVTVSFELNGRTIIVESQPDRTLLQVLREDLGMTGTKKGCDEEGLCGTCTVIIVGEAIIGHTRAALLNAICDAVDTRITRIPVTPARLLESLRWV